MVLTPRPPPGPALIPTIRSTVTGYALCMEDASGHQHPVALAYVELHTSDPIHTRRARSSLIVSANTEDDGKFTLGTTYDLTTLPWWLRFENPYTQETKELRKVLGSPTRMLVLNVAHWTFELGSIVLPWDPMRPALAEVNGRYIKSHLSLSQMLSAHRQSTGTTVTLLREVATPRVLRDRELDGMFRTLAAEAHTPTGLVDRIVASMRRTITVNPLERDIYDNAKVLAVMQQRIARAPTREIYAEHSLAKQIGGYFAAALGMSFLPPAFNDPLPGLAAAQFLVFVATHLAQGHTVDVQLSQLEDRHNAQRHRHYRTIRVIIS